MKTTLIRLLLFAVSFLILHFVVHSPAAVLWAFVAAWVFEPLVSTKM